MLTCEQCVKFWGFLCHLEIESGKYRERSLPDETSSSLNETEGFLVGLAALPLMSSTLVMSQSVCSSNLPFDAPNIPRKSLEPTLETREVLALPITRLGHHGDGSPLACPHRGLQWNSCNPALDEDTKIKKLRRIIFLPGVCACGPRQLESIS